MNFHNFFFFFSNFRYSHIYRFGVDGSANRIESIRARLSSWYPRLYIHIYIYIFFDVVRSPLYIYGALDFTDPVTRHCRSVTKEEKEQENTRKIGPTQTNAMPPAGRPSTVQVRPSSVQSRPVYSFLQDDPKMVSSKSADIEILLFVSPVKLKHCFRRTRRRSLARERTS